MNGSAILNKIESRSVDERAEFDARLTAEQPSDEPEMSPELAQLLDERIAAANANPNVGYTLEEVIAYVKRVK